MSQRDTLKSLESLLESFLDRVVAVKEQRLAVLEGINRLDDIARQSSRGANVTDDVGDWFAEHNKWLTGSSLRRADIDRINTILGEFKKELRTGPESSPAEDKIHTEIDRWNRKTSATGPKLVLKRGPETKVRPPEAPTDTDTISLFDKKLERLTAVFKDASGGKQHLLSVVDDLLTSAKVQSSKDALILSGFIIYYLKQNGYKVEPYVKRLKEAETLLRERALDA